MKIKPAPGLKVRDPDLKDYLPEEGRVVPDTAHWFRLKRDGDVVDVVDGEAPTEGEAQ